MLITVKTLYFCELMIKIELPHCGFFSVRYYGGEIIENSENNMSTATRTGGFPPSTGRAMNSVVKVENITPGGTFQNTSGLLESDYPTSPNELKHQVQRTFCDGMHSIVFF